MGRREEGTDWESGRVRSWAHTLERGGVLGEAGGVGDPGGAGVRRLRRRRPWRRAVVGWGRRRCLCRRHGAASSSSVRPPFRAFDWPSSFWMGRSDGQGFGNGLLIFRLLVLGQSDGVLGQRSE